MKTKSVIKILIVVVITVIMGFSDYSFAENDLMTFSEVLNFGVSIMSWIWVLFAKGAGMFLTNKWVYGEAIGLDVLLRKYWTVMKNMANFCLGFYFVYVIFRALIDKDGITKKIKNIILRMLVAGIGVQMSWFAVAALIDVSTITLVAAGAIPSQIISQDVQVQESFEMTLDSYLDNTRSKVVSGEVFMLFPTTSASTDMITSYPIVIDDSKFTKERLFDEILPNEDSVSGPLYYMGFSILNTQNLPSFGTATEETIKATIFNTILQGGTSLVYGIEMLVLMILAVMRVAYIRIFIVLCPLMVLVFCIRKGEGSKGGKQSGLLSVFENNFNFKSFFINIFKPTFVVLLIGLTVIFVSLMKGVIISNGNKPVNIGGVIISSEVDKTTISEGNENITYTTTLDSNLLHFTMTKAAQTLLGLFLSIITVILVYIIIRFAVNMGSGNDFVTKGIKKVQKTVDDFAGSVPLVPVAGYDSKTGQKTTHYISAGGALGLGDNKGMLSSGVDVLSGKINKRVYEQAADLERAFGWEASLDWISIKRAGVGKNGQNALLAYKEEINKYKTEKGSGLTLNTNNEWRKLFEDWLDELKDKDPGANTFDKDRTVWQGMIEYWKQDGHTLEGMFDGNKERIRAYADFFELGDVKDWVTLKKMDISKK